MFLNILKYRALNKSIERNLLKAQPVILKDTIEDVGVIIEEDDYSYREIIIEELVKYNIKEENIFFLLISKKKNMSTKRNFYVSPSDFSLKGELKNNDIIEFINRPFDLLINYYPVGKSMLLWSSIFSKAKFKVGFASVSKNVNHFVINISTNKYKDYIKELFRYLEILKSK